MTAALALVLLAAAVRPAETAAAREQARLCEKLTGEESLEACRRAIQLGLGPARLRPVRQIVARRLAALERWDELAGHFRDDVAQDPEDGEARLRLGSTLLFALSRSDDSIVELSEAVRLAPDSAIARSTLAVALAAAGGRAQEAQAEFLAALRLDDHLLDHRPATSAAFEATRRGETWP
jgi:tetratricopeptide (TPR) repeat protein